jgi:hypothetical protein
MDQNKLDFLANSIKQARTVMQKVEERNFTPSTSGKALSEMDVDTMLDDNVQYLTEEQVMNRAPQAIPQMSPQFQQQAYTQPVPLKNLATSKMPQAILESFMGNPISDPSAPIGFDMMMNEIAKKAGTQQTAPAVKQPKKMVDNTPKQITQEVVAPQLDTKLIEYIIKKTVEETLEQVSKKTPISENIQIKIGDKTFSGKITSLNEIKKTKK